MNYLEKLNSAADKFSSIVCMGMDPVLENIPLDGSPEEKILKFYESILNKIVSANVFPGAVKPNYAFYAQYGLSGISALKTLAGMYKQAGIPVILDVKRGDIGSTAAAYAKEAFDFFDADAVTLSPYMGYDSIKPFTEYEGRGAYILVKTSNASSGDLQDADCGGEPLFIRTAKKITEWHFVGIGAVAGATYIEQLDKIAGVFQSSGKPAALLIPGVGAQGGSASDVMRVLRKYGNVRIHRINSSGGINYAWKKHPNMHYADAAVDAIKRLNDEIGEI